MVDFLRSLGHRVEPGGRTPGGRWFDAIVDGIEVDFKTPHHGANSSTMRNRANESKRRGGQARVLIFDVRESGMPPEEAERGCDRIRGAYSNYFDIIRVIGDDYDFSERI